MTKIIFNTLLGLVLILIWLHFVNFSEIILKISTADKISIVFIFLFMLLSPIIRALRLKIFLSEVKNIPLKDLIFLNGASLMLNFFIPIRAGEIAKGVYLNTKYGLNLGTSVIWIFIDRFVDFLAVLALAVILLSLVPTSLNITFIVIIIVIFILALLTTYLAIFQLDFSKKMVSFLKTLFIVKNIKIYFERLTNFILEAFSILNRHPKDIILMMLLTILAYGADGLIFYFTFISLHVPQGFLQMYLAQLLSALIYLIPAAPGYVGSTEASGLIVLSGVLGIDTKLSSAMIVLFHILTAIFVLIFGLISIYSLKINLGVVFKKTFKRG